MENKVTAYIEELGWIDIDVSSLRKTNEPGDMALIEVWHFISPTNGKAYSINRQMIKIIKGEKEAVFEINNKD